jgi:hypothetical protein
LQVAGSFEGTASPGEGAPSPREGEPSPGPGKASPAPPEETPAEKVTRLTNEAQAECDKREFEPCGYLLDQAKEIDRDNEYRPPVIKMRHAIRDSTRKH